MIYHSQSVDDSLNNTTGRTCQHVYVFLRLNYYDIRGQLAPFESDPIIY
jgi:hypothetical protein